MFIFFKCVVNSHMCPNCSVSVNMSKIEFNKKFSIYQVACFSTVAPTTPFTVCPYCKVDFYPPAIMIIYIFLTDTISIMMMLMEDPRCTVTRRRWAPI